MIEGSFTLTALIKNLAAAGRCLKQQDFCASSVRRRPFMPPLPG